MQRTVIPTISHSSFRTFNSKSGKQNLTLVSFSHFSPRSSGTHWWRQLKRLGYSWISHARSFIYTSTAWRHFPANRSAGDDWRWITEKSSSCTFWGACAVATLIFILTFIRFTSLRVRWFAQIANTTTPSLMGYLTWSAPLRFDVNGF